MSKIVSANGDNVVCVPKVAGCQPTGSQVMVELLTTQEMMGTKLHVGDEAVRVQGQAYQGYIVSLGPSCKGEDWGFKVGDRVLFDGMGVPVPNYDGSHREKVLGEPHSIKGVLSEA